MCLRFGDRSDEELMELARAGWAPAFAVLVHRYAPLVRAATPGAADRHAAVVEVFAAAMRQLDERDAGAAVAPWLLALAGAARPAAPQPLPDEEIDALWAELHRRWPDGRRPTRRVPRNRAAAVLALVAVAAVVPTVVLGADGTADDDVLELRAVPLPDERTAPPEDEPDDEEALDFTFPESPTESEPPPPTETPTGPSPEPAEPAGTAPSEDEPAEDEPAASDGEAEEDTTTGEDDGGQEDSDGLLDGIVGTEDDADAGKNGEDTDSGGTDSGSGDTDGGSTDRGSTDSGGSSGSTGGTDDADGVEAQ